MRFASPERGCKSPSTYPKCRNAEVKRGFRNQASVSLNLGRPGENRYEHRDKTSCFLLTGLVSDAEAFEVPGDVESTENLFVLPEKREELQHL